MTSEALIFLLRVLLLAVLYLFLLLVVLAIRHDVVRESGQNGSRPCSRLLVLDPGATLLEPGQELPLTSRTTIGRGGRNSIVLDDSFVSSDHAAIRFDHGAWWIDDRGSTNGTLVNEAPVDGSRILTYGDVIEIGEIRLKLVA